MKKLLFIFLITLFPMFLLAQQVKPDGSNWRHTGTNEYTKPLTIMGVALSNTTINAWNALLTQNADTIELGSVAVLDVDSTRNISGHYTPRYDFKYEATLSVRNLLKAAGSNVKVTLTAVELGGGGSNYPLVDGTLYYAMTLVTDSTLLSTFQYSLQTTGNFTGDNNNAIGIYSTSGVTYTKIGNTATDATGTIWKTSAGATSTLNLVTPVWLAPGKYLVMYLYNSSAQVTAPVTYAIGIAYGLQYATALPNSTSIIGISSAATYTDLPASVVAGDFYATSTCAMIFGF